MTNQWALEADEIAARLVNGCDPADAAASLRILAHEMRASVEPREDPLAGVRWICRNCGTSNGIDDVSCLGCRKPREEQDRRVENRPAEPT
jgi:hypothetical protein